MADFLTTADSIARIEGVIRQADGDLHLVSPYVQLSERYRRRLADADADGVTTHLVCRARDLKADQQAFLSSLSRLRLYDAPKLHGKVFVNGRGAVLTSFNLYEASEQNHETGVWLCADADRQAYDDVRREVASIIGHATEVRPDKAPSAKTEAPKAKEGRGRFLVKAKGAPPAAGHCIRCGAGVDYDPKRPYCPACFRQWARFKNPAYGDDRCHGCGGEDAKAFSLEKPECRRCYKRNARRAQAAAA